MTSAFSGRCSEERWGGATPEPTVRFGDRQQVLPEHCAPHRSRFLHLRAGQQRGAGSCAFWSLQTDLSVSAPSSLLHPYLISSRGQDFPQGSAYTTVIWLKCLRNCSTWWSSLLLQRRKNWGIWLICCPFTSVEKTVRSIRESLIRCLFSQLQRSLSFFLCIFHLSMSPCPTPSIFPLFRFGVFINILLSLRKSHSYSFLQIRFRCAEFSGSNQGNPKLTWYLHP